MYQQLLTNRYLASRIIPLIAVAAVGLCVALVIIVVSVMTGFLDMVRESGRVLMGDVVIQRSVQGMPYYDELIGELEALPEVAAATPLVDTWGLLQMPYPEGERKATKTVQVWGIEIDGFRRVTGFSDSLYWKRPDEQALANMAEDDPRRFIDDESYDLIKRDTDALHRSARSNGLESRPGIVLGMHVSDANVRQADSSYRQLGNWWMLTHDVALAVLPTAEGIGASVRYDVQTFGVVNEFVSGVHIIDQSRVMIPLDVAQRMTNLDESEIVDPDTLDEQGLPVAIGTNPARATMVLVRAVDGVNPDQLRAVVDRAYAAFAERINADAARDALMPFNRGQLQMIEIMTWEEQQASFLGPIQKERELMRTLFSIVYLVCAGLVLAIFWSIVHEKTRDIGILRSIGASRIGIVGIFLRYGLTIGVLGAALGFGLATLVVTNINGIHNALEEPPIWLAALLYAAALGVAIVTGIMIRTGRLLPFVLGVLGFLVLAGLAGLITYVRYIGGVTIWDPTVYYFPRIPNEVDMRTAIQTMVGGVIFSLLGAMLPAAKAADTDPVEALRYE